MKESFKRGFFNPYFVLVVELLVTALASYSFVRLVDSRDRQVFIRSVRETKITVETRMNTFIYALRGAKGFVDASEKVSRQEFRRYVRSLRLINYQEGFENVGLTVRFPAGSSGTEKHEVLYLEPMNRLNRSALGQDLFAIPQRRAAMEEARDSGEPAATTKIQLTETLKKGAGFALYLPVYKTSVLPSTVRERRKQLRGFVYIPFRAHDLFEKTYDRYAASRIRLQIFEEAGGMLYDSHPSSRFRGSVSEKVTLKIAGRRWSLVFQSLPAFERYSARHLWKFIMLAGSIISLMLFLITRAETMARKKAEEAEEMQRKAYREMEQRVVERTQELSNAHHALEMEMQERLQAKKEMLEISAKEQQRFGQDLHDGLSQKLTGISFLVKTLQKKLDRKNSTETTETTEILTLIKEAITETKVLSRGLNPVELEPNGLIAAFQELCLTSEKVFHIAAAAQCDESIVISDHSVATHLYRIAQEAMHQAIRYGKANQISLMFEKKEGAAVLRIEDNRTHFPPPDDTVIAVGLRNMRHRAQIISAALHIEKIPAGRAVLRCSLPL